MKYRRVGRTDLEFSVISFGGMRYGHDDLEEEGIAMVHRALDLGVNFFETGPLYKNSMAWLGKAFRGRQEEIHVCSKAICRPSEEWKPGWMMTADDARRNIDWSLETLGVERLDLFGGWSLSNNEMWEAFFAKGGPLEGIYKAIDERLVSYVYATSHDVPENVVQWLKTGEFAAVTIPYNIAKRHFRVVIDYCQEHQIGCFTMQPTAGGLLASTSGQLGQLIAEHVGEQDPAQAAQRWLLAHAGITCVPVGFTSLDQVNSSCEIADEADALMARGEDAVDYLADYADLASGLCTRCGYCEPCPQGLPLRNAIQPFQMWKILDDEEALKAYLSRLKVDPAECVACGQCTERCPQSLPIADFMAEMVEQMKRLGISVPAQ
ncbi:aldo/keto reductase [bacterium]|nr:aldo/keto reductase [bacterium]